MVLYDLLQYFVLAKEEVIFVRYAFAKGETRRHQYNWLMLYLLIYTIYTLINVNPLLSLGKEKLRAELRRHRGQGRAAMMNLGDRTWGADVASVMS